MKNGIVHKSNLANCTIATHDGLLTIHIVDCELTVCYNILVIFVRLNSFIRPVHSARVWIITCTVKPIINNSFHHQTTYHWTPHWKPVGMVVARRLGRFKQGPLLRRKCSIQKVLVVTNRCCLSHLYRNHSTLAQSIYDRREVSLTRYLCKYFYSCKSETNLQNAQDASSGDVSCARGTNHYATVLLSNNALQNIR